MERALGFQRVGFTGVCFGSLIATVSIPEFSAYCGLVRHPSLHLEWKQIQQQGCDTGGKGSSYYGNYCFLALNGASGDDCAALCYRASIVQRLGRWQDGFGTYQTIMLSYTHSLYFPFSRILAAV